LAATESEVGVDEALRKLIAQGKPITAQAVETLLGADEALPAATDVRIDAIELQSYDGLLDSAWEGTCQPVLS
jgi:hypothetical protein